MKVLFICKGNVGRSQMAEHIFNKLVDGKHVAYSCGTAVKDSNEGGKIKNLEGAEKIVTLLAELGIDIGDAERNQLTPQMLEESDKIILMSNDETVPDHLHKNKKVIYWELNDPKEMSLEETRSIRDQIENLVKELIKTL